MNYLSFFSLAQEPFSNAPVSRFYFNSPGHARALVRMMFAIENMKGLAVLTGDIGAGKSTTARRLLESLPEDRFEVALLVMVQSSVHPQWLLTKIAYQLGVTQPAEDKTRLLGQLYRRLYTIHESGRKAVVLIDEAQMLDTRELMEEIRGLLNMEIPEQKLLTLCLFGLPPLEDHLKLDSPLYQRVAVRVHLQPLAAEATEAYIKHRLRLAGAQKMLFTQEAVASLHRYSQGVPRLINTVCDNALFEGFLARTNPINSRIVDAVVRELGYDGSTELGGEALRRPEPEPSRRPEPEPPRRDGDNRTYAQWSDDVPSEGLRRPPEDRSSRLTVDPELSRGGPPGPGMRRAAALTSDKAGGILAEEGVHWNSERATTLSGVGRTWRSTTEPPPPEPAWKRRTPKPDDAPNRTSPSPGDVEEWLSSFDKK